MRQTDLGLSKDIPLLMQPDSSTFWQLASRKAPLVSSWNGSAVESVPSSGGPVPQAATSGGGCVNTTTTCSPREMLMQRTVVPLSPRSAVHYKGHQMKLSLVQSSIPGRGTINPFRLLAVRPEPIYACSHDWASNPPGHGWSCNDFWPACFTRRPGIHVVGHRAYVLCEVLMVNSPCATARWLSLTSQHATRHQVDKVMRRRPR